MGEKFIEYLLEEVKFGINIWVIHVHSDIFYCLNWENTSIFLHTRSAFCCLCGILVLLMTTSFLGNDQAYCWVDYKWGSHWQGDQPSWMVWAVWLKTPYREAFVEGHIRSDNLAAVQTGTGPSKLEGFQIIKSLATRTVIVNEHCMKLFKLFRTSHFHGDYRDILCHYCLELIVLSKLKGDSDGLHWAWHLAE